MDLPPEVSTVAIQVAGSMVSTMFTDAWKAVSRRFAKTMGREDVEQEERVLVRLNRERHRLEGADSQHRQPLEGFVIDAWADDLTDFLRANPESLLDFRALVAEIQSSQQTSSVGTSVHQVARATGKGSTVNQVGGSQYNFGQR